MCTPLWIDKNRIVNFVQGIILGFMLSTNYAFKLNWSHVNVCSKACPVVWFTMSHHFSVEIGMLWVQYR